MKAAYQTNNLSLAVVLATCGVPFYSTPEGQLAPVVNIYTRENLAALGFKGRTLEEGAEEAYRKGRPGLVVFAFERTPDLEAIVKAYDDQAEVSKRAGAEGGKTHAQDAGELDVDPAIAARLGFQFLKNRKTLRDAWKAPVPLLAIQGESRSRTDSNGAKVTLGSCKIISLGASKATRNRLGL